MADADGSYLWSPYSTLPQSPLPKEISQTAILPARKEGEGSISLMRVVDVLTNLGNLAQRIHDEVFAVMRQQDSYRSFLVWKCTEHALQDAVNFAYGMVTGNMLEGRKPTGPRYMSVRDVIITRPSWPNAPYGVGRHSSYWCVYRRPHRPSLSAQAWKRGYEARLKARRKTDRTRKRTGVKVPKTVYPRPKRSRQSASVTKSNA